MKILIGVDGSGHAERALWWGLQEARFHGASVTVLYAFHVPEFTGPLDRPVAHEQERAAAQELVAKAVAGAGDDVEVDIETVATITDVAARVLLDHARHHDLVVVGSRGRGGFSGLLLGSVSQQVSAHAGVPVAVIPSGRDGDPGPEAVRSIVVGVDGSPHSVQALRWAVDEARVRHCPLTAVYVYPSPAVTLTSDVLAGLNQVALESFYARSAAVAQRVLDELIAERVAPADVAAIERRVVEGSAAPFLVDEAADPSTMLVVGSRGRGGFAGLLLGSVSQQCLHHARGPVVVVHHTTPHRGVHRAGARAAQDRGETR